MAGSDFLRENVNQHIKKNTESLPQEKILLNAVLDTMKYLEEEYPLLEFSWQKRMLLSEVLSILKENNKKIINSFCKEISSSKRNDYSEFFKSSYFQPDGGIVSFTSNKIKKIILITEAKRQGTNDKRLEENKEKQSKGNAVERLGKNLIIIRNLFRNEKIIPFICFGHGCDFDLDSSIIDRVISMNDMFHLNEIYVKKENLPFEPVSMMFRKDKWTQKEIFEICKKVAITSIEYYLEQKNEVLPL